MVPGQRGAEGRDRVVEAVAVQGDDVRVAFADDRDLRLHDAALGQVEAVERPPLDEDLALRTVEILRLVLGGDLPGAERDGLSELVADREDQAVSEPVDRRAARGGADQSDPLEHLPVRQRLAVGGVAEAGGLLDAIDQRRPGVRRVAETERLREFGGDSAILEDLPGLRARLRLPQLPLEETIGETVRAADLRAKRRAVVVAPSTAVELDARPIGEELQHLGKLQAVMTHEEVDRVAARRAGVAEVLLLQRIDVEGGTRIVVERTEPDVLDALRLERKILRHERHQVGGLEYAVAVGLERGGRQGRDRGRGRRRREEGDGSGQETSDAEIDRWRNGPRPGAGADGVTGGPWPRPQRSTPSRGPRGQGASNLVRLRTSIRMGGVAQRVAERHLSRSGRTRGISGTTRCPLKSGGVCPGEGWRGALGTKKNSANVRL